MIDRSAVTSCPSLPSRGFHTRGRVSSSSPRSRGGIPKWAISPRRHWLSPCSCGGMPCLGRSGVPPIFSSPAPRGDKPSSAPASTAFAQYRQSGAWAAGGEALWLAPAVHLPGPLWFRSEPSCQRPTSAVSALLGLVTGRGPPPSHAPTKPARRPPVRARSFPGILRCPMRRWVRPWMTGSYWAASERRSYKETDPDSG